MKIDFYALLETIKPIKKIIQAITAKGGTAYLVGGAVRDLVLGNKLVDLDIEVHNLAPEQLETTLKKFRKVSLVGKKFGVYKLHGIDVDWSLPRKDSTGRHPTVHIDTSMDVKEACRRRDITINSMVINLSKFINHPEKEPKIVDPFDGLNDIETKTLRATDIKLFNDDPLRFYRVMQFVSRFEMVPDEQLNALCKTIQLGPENVAQERITEEIKKLLLKSKQPSLGFRWVAKIGRLKELFPELGQTIEMPQRPDFHPEGNVFEHTMQALDAAARFSAKSFQTTNLFVKTNSEKLTLLLSTLCHDLGKLVTTDKLLHSYGHQTKGLKLVNTFLLRFSFNKKINSAVLAMVEFHHHPRLLTKSKPSKYKVLASKLAPHTNIRLLTILSISDGQGRNPTKNKPLSEISTECVTFLKRAIELGVNEAPELPVLTGNDLIAKGKQGTEIGKLLRKAYLIQIKENVQNTEQLLKRII
ncbi:CCA tRNA nucleotidyltransferase [Candidatus Babeliales bacterium]|nr:CCA tRNA nucleotidyltransferase [Candidatus Babeliales bacterium]